MRESDKPGLWHGSHEGPEAPRRGEILPRTAAFDGFRVKEQTFRFEFCSDGYHVHFVHPKRLTGQRVGRAKGGAKASEGQNLTQRGCTEPRTAVDERFKVPEQELIVIWSEIC